MKTSYLFLFIFSHYVSSAMNCFCGSRSTGVSLKYPFLKKPSHAAVEEIFLNIVSAYTQAVANNRDQNLPSLEVQSFQTSSVKIGRGGQTFDAFKKHREQPIRVIHMKLGGIDCYFSYHEKTGKLASYTIYFSDSLDRETVKNHLIQRDGLSLWAGNRFEFSLCMNFAVYVNKFIKKYHRPPNSKENSPFLSALRNKEGKCKPQTYLTYVTTSAEVNDKDHIAAKVLYEEDNLSTSSGERETEAADTIINSKGKIPAISHTIPEGVDETIEEPPTKLAESEDTQKIKEADATLEIEKYEETEEIAHVQQHKQDTEEEEFDSDLGGDLIETKEVKIEKEVEVVPEKPVKINEEAAKKVAKMPPPERTREHIENEWKAILNDNLIHSKSSGKKVVLTRGSEPLYLNQVTIMGNPDKQTEELIELKKILTEKNQVEPSDEEVFKEWRKLAGIYLRKRNMVFTLMNSLQKINDVLSQKNPKKVFKLKVYEDLSIKITQEDNNITEDFLRMIVEERDYILIVVILKQFVGIKKVKVYASVFKNGEESIMMEYDEELGEGMDAHHKLVAKVVDDQAQKQGMKNYVVDQKKLKRVLI